MLYHFDMKHFILIKTNVFSYAISGILSQLTLHNLNQWHLISYYLRKMISAKICYKTHNKNFLAIVEAFKI